MTIPRHQWQERLQAVVEHPAGKEHGLDPVSAGLGRRAWRLLLGHMKSRINAEERTCESDGGAEKA